MKTILPTIIAPLVLTGVAGSAAMIRSTDASDDPRDAAWYSRGEAFAPVSNILSRSRRHS
jgi:hypothetical protein